MADKKAEPITFRVYPENGFLYAVVNIWPTKKAMYAHKPLQRNHEASCTGRKVINIRAKKRGKAQRSRLRGVFAEINFYKGALGIGCVSHDMTHAMFCWAERRNLRIDEASLQKAASLRVRKRNNVLPTDCIVERCCYALGEMCRQFTMKCYDLDLYNEFVVVAK